MFQLLTLFVIAAAPGQSERCSAVPQTVLDEPRIRFTERYTNESWGYALTIPPGMTAYSQASPPYHGVWFVLGDSPHGVIALSGAANSLEFKTPRAAARDELRMLRETGKKIESNAVTTFRLAGLPAARMETRYRCDGDPARYVDLHVFVLRPPNEPLYEISLLTTVDRLGDDRPIFERILANVKFIKW